MTVVNPKSISGINSITMASGSDNLLTIHSNNTTERFRIDSSGNVKVGTAATISPDGDLFVTGISTFGGDVQVPDKIIHSGDTNTAIRFPAADTITAETGGSERARIDSSGNFMVGTTSPSGILHVEHSAENNSYLVGNTSTSGARLILQNKNTTANSYTGVLGADAGGETTSQILFYSADNDNNEGYLTLGTRPSGGVPTERLRITSSGRVSVGNNASPDGPLHVYQSSAGSVTADTSANLGVFESGETNSGITLLCPNTGKQQIYFGTTGTGGSYEAGIRYTHESHGTTADRRAMHFRVGGGERARIQNGRLLVGRTNNISVGGDASDHCFEQITDNGYALTVHSNTANQRGIGVYYPDNSNTPQVAFAYQVGNNFKCIIRDDGDLENANNNYGSISDVSLKENIVDANSQWDDIKNIKVRNYNFKESTGQPTHKQIGVIAQELETVCPNLVDVTRDTGKKNVAYSILYMKSVKALQEAMARIETLEAKVAALEGS